MESRSGRRWADPTSSAGWLGLLSVTGSLIALASAGIAVLVLASLSVLPSATLPALPDDARTDGHPSVVVGSKATPAAPRLAIVTVAPPVRPARVVVALPALLPPPPRVGPPRAIPVAPAGRPPVAAPVHVVPAPPPPPPASAPEQARPNVPAPVPVPIPVPAVDASVVALLPIPLGQGVVAVLPTPHLEEPLLLDGRGTKAALERAAEPAEHPVPATPAPAEEDTAKLADHGEREGASAENSKHSKEDGKQAADEQIGPHNGPSPGDLLDR